jgi:hypothetical protein
MTSGMCAGNHLNQSGINHKEETVGEAPQQAPPRALVDDGIHLRIALDGCQSSFNSQQEFSTQSRSLLLVPDERRLDIVLGRLPEN